MGDGNGRFQVSKVSPPPTPQKESPRVGQLPEEAGSPFSNARFFRKTPSRDWLMIAAPGWPLQ